MQQFHQTLRNLAARLIPAIALIVFVSISPKAAALVQVTAFGATLNLPNSLPAGSVISRHTIPLSQLCSSPPCEVTSISLWPNGGGATLGGPLIQTNVPGISTRLLVNGQPATLFNIGNNKTMVKSPLEVQLVRDERSLSAGSLSGQQGGNPSYFYVCTPTIGDYAGNMCMSNKNGLAIALSATVKLVNGTCSTPDQSVVLTKMVLEKFKGVGSTGDPSGTKGFNLRFNNCPPSFARISYELSPTGGPLPAIPGALPVAGGSTATGVAIQITDTSGTPAKFNQRFTLSAYNSSTGGSYTIPMNARYIQTAATITPGTISGMMSVLMDYQ
ncbi:fimbrial protein [Pseudomonas chlororaphis]|uniref:fimbrial protein n=1 Tax=Pseudomonas chlororaphis TaxID=587753 RepID=UPI000E0AF17F|nr:fimbrial protein [Pseudomonas chlororaphis]AZD14357.1 hypothetical protein C4K25_1411 [Pseudomonas chlororaphis]WDH48829.1 fimbrial protein [Pseudomonas chlororaphis]WDH60679.1 fimbrial protein [Pseudomonas chlororaphis]WQE19934.1 fimbrial protein [Pseudomonas chlororaphis]